MDLPKKANASAYGVFLFRFFFFMQAFLGRRQSCCSHTQSYRSRTIHDYSLDLQPLYLEKNIKNRSHGTIHVFKNYFVTVFSVFSKINCIQTDSM